MEDEDLEKILGQQERILDVQEEQARKIENIKERVSEIEGLDLTEYLKEGEEKDEVVDKRIANLLEIASQLHDLNSYKRDAILDYLAKKSSVNKTDIKKVVKTFEKYLEKLL